MATLPVNKFTNRATAKIAADLNSADTAITLVPGGGDWFPAPTGGDFFRLVLQKGTSQTDQREYMTCTARAGDVLTVVRGQEGTPAANFTVGDEVSLVATALTLDEFVQKSGVTMKGALEVEAPPTTPLGIATKQFVEDGRLPDAPIDGETYGRKDAAWSLLGDAASLPVPIPIDKGGTAGTTLTEAQTNLIIGLTTINDLPPATPKYGDRWIKPSNMTEMVWVPNAGGGGAGVWINPADAASEAYPLAVDKGGTGAITAAAARVNLGITPANIAALALDGTTVMTGQVKLADGTVAAPGLTFGSEVGMGFFRSAASTVALAVGGVSAQSLTAQAAVTFNSLYPRAAGATQFTLFDKPASDANYTQFYFRTEAATHIIAESRGGTGVAKPLNITFPSGIGLNGNVSVQGDVKINPDTGSFRFGTQGGAVNLNQGNGFPAIQFSATGTDYQIIHVRSTGDLVYQKPGSPAKNLFTVFGNEGGTNFVGTVAAGNEVIANTSLRATNGNCYVKGALRTTGDASIIFDTAYTTQYVALGDPSYGSQFQMAFFHAPGTWAGIRFIVQSAQYQFTDSGIPRATRAGPWDALVSDIRIKDVHGDYTEGLAEILRLRPRRFSFKPETKLGSDIQIGLIAQEAQQDMPSLVSPSTVDEVGDIKMDNPLTVGIGPVTWALVNAVKELNQRLTQLETA